MEDVTTIFGHHDILGSDSSVEFCLDNPLYCGFLLKFCESEYNAENVRFILAVDGFRDMVIAHDSTTWTKSWQELDKEYISLENLDLPTSEILSHETGCKSRRSSISAIQKTVRRDVVGSSSNGNSYDERKRNLNELEDNNSSHSNNNISGNINDNSNNKGNSNSKNNSKEDDDDVVVEWTSRLSKKDFDRTARYIWNEYLSESSTSQICVPATVAIKTKRRYKLRHLYGPDVFNESCIDPIKTVKRDILPRFIVSSVCQFLDEHLKQDGLESTLTTNNLSLLLPSNFRIEGKKPDAISLDREFELHEFLDTGILYYEFLNYLRSSVASENLLCVRMIDIYEDLIANPKSHDEAIEQAWRIYKSFIAPSSVYEISLNHLDRKDIMLRMANPNMVIFESAKKSAYLALRSKFEQYRSTKEYKNLPYLVREKLTKAAENHSNLDHSGIHYGRQLACFGK